VDLPALWFVAIGLLWTGYLVLEGFDFGVGMLLRWLGHEEHDRRVLLATIGPVWDGNEVWLIVAVGATFAAFPAWYATLLSGFYLPVFAVLVALILRVVAFEFRGTLDRPWWRLTWDVALFAGSLVPAFTWGTVLTGLVEGIPLGPGGHLVGSPLVAVSPVAALGGVSLVALCGFHGAIFLRLKTAGELRRRAARAALPLGLLAIGLAAALAIVEGSLPGLLAVPALAVAALLTTRDRDGLAFAAAATAVVLWTAGVFTRLYPSLVISSLGPAFDLTVSAAASAPYTLTLMTWLAAFGLPFVIVSQGWTYWIFRRRLAGERPAPAQ
jgi:cytochrome bd ubiquinol oxidase subunit II